MKKNIILFLLIPFLSIAQDRGIVFEHNSTWEQIKTKAKVQNKYIFVDCFTTWCGPCKYMATTVFTQQKVGDFFNANFINLKLQFDQTNRDNEEVKSWYEDAIRFTKDYKVVAFPTFLIFNQDGEFVHRIVGSGEADEFIAKVEKGLHKETQYANMLKRFEENPNDVDNAQRLAITAKNIYEIKVAERAMNKYIALAGTDVFFTAPNIPLFKDGGNSSQSPIFKLLAENQAKADEALRGEDISTNDILSKILLKELVQPGLQKSDSVINFSTLQTNIEKAYPYVDMTKALAQPKIQYYYAKKNWLAYKDAVNAYLAVTDKLPSSSMLNSYASSIFENSDDRTSLTDALQWSKKAVEQEEKSAYIQTYANLLYRLGDKTKAIEWQGKAVEKGGGNYKKEYVATLDKMKNGQPTWD